MSFNLFLVRHATTDWNKMGFLSETDIELSSTGIKQSKELASRLKDIRIDMIFSSPMKRCMRTAEEISRSKGVEIIKDDSLKELNFGIFEGLSSDEAKAKYPSFFEKREADRWNFKIPQGESYKDAYGRILKFMQRLESLASDGNIVIVTHATIIKILLYYFGKLTFDDIQKNRVETIGEASCRKVTLGVEAVVEPL